MGSVSVVLDIFLPIILGVGVLLGCSDADILSRLEPGYFEPYRLVRELKCGLVFVASSQSK